MPTSPPRVDGPPPRRPADPDRVRDEYLRSGGAARPVDEPPVRPDRQQDRQQVRLLCRVLLPLGVLVLGALVLLWPSGPAPRVERAAAAAVPAGTSWPDARVVTVTPYDCSPAGAAQPLTCATAVVEVVDGDDAGAYQQVDLAPQVWAAGVHVGDGLVLTRDAGAGGGPAYAFADLARSTPLALLALGLVAAVAVVGRLRGLAALGAGGLTGAVLLRFELPALLRGEPAVPVVLTGGALAAVAVVGLLHGVSVRTATALLGTLSGLLLVTGLGGLATGAARLTGLAATPQLAQWDPTQDLSGLVVAGSAVAALGVLVWLSVAQTRTVAGLAAAEPTLGWRTLTARGLAEGRPRAGLAVLLTLLASTGAALPLLLVVELSAVPLSTQLTGAAVAEVVVRTLAAGTGVVLAVPATTAIAAAVATLGRTEGATVPTGGFAALRARLSR